MLLGRALLKGEDVLKRLAFGKSFEHFLTKSHLGRLIWSAICLIPRIDDINNRKIEEQFTQLVNELQEFQFKKDVNKDRLKAIKRRLKYLRGEITNFKKSPAERN